MPLNRSTIFFAVRALTLFAIVAFSYDGFAQLIYRPGQEYRSLNTDVYQISIQKNGRLDVVLSSGSPVFLNVFPMIRYADAEEPKLLKLDGRWSQRYGVEDPLGDGHGMHIKYKNCEWSIRAYPTKPFMAVQVSYINDTKKPVAIAELHPWCVGDPKKGGLTLGPGTENSAILENLFGRTPQLVTGAAESPDALALYNATSTRSLIIGTLTQTAASSRLTVGRSEKAEEDSFDQFRASTIFDPPVVVEPGDRLDSDVYYIALGEANAVVGLQRFARAIAIANDLPVDSTPPPNGWMPSTINESEIVAGVELLSENLQRYGWTHVDIGAGWADATGDWTPSADRFPNGFESVTRSIHDKGMTAGLWIDPLLVHRDAEFAARHPDWLLPTRPARLGLPPSRTLLLDTQNTQVLAHLRGLGQQARDWGFDSVFGFDEQIASAPENVAEENLLTGIQAFLDGFGADRQAIPSETSFAMALQHAARLVRTNESLSDAAQSSALSPHLWRPVVQTDLSHPAHESRMALTALMGGAIRLVATADDLQRQASILRRLSPSGRRSAHPVDLFASEEPRIWIKRDGAAQGGSLTAGLINWSPDQPQSGSLSFESLGLRGDVFHTVYDIWNEQYYGTARGTLSAQVAPGGIRLLGFREYLRRPNAIALDGHFLKGNDEFESLEWSATNRRLEGSFVAIENTDYTLRVLSPEPYALKASDASVADFDVSTNDTLITMRLRSAEVGPITWSLQF